MMKDNIKDLEWFSIQVHWDFTYIGKCLRWEIWAKKVCYFFTESYFPYLKGSWWGSILVVYFFYVFILRNLGGGKLRENLTHTNISRFTYIPGLQLSFHSPKCRKEVHQGQNRFFWKSHLVLLSNLWFIFFRLFVTGSTKDSVRSWVWLSHVWDTVL